MPFKRKHPVSPNAAIANPANIGPMTRERLNCIELSEIAFIRSSRPTRSRKRDWCDGIVNAFATPFTIATAATSGTDTNPKPTAAARKKAHTIWRDCVAIRSFRRLARSAATPASGARRSVGIEPANPTRPRTSAESESRSTSHPWATTCIHVPMFDRKSPIQ